MAKKELTYKGKTEEASKKIKEATEFAEQALAKLRKWERMREDPTICECPNGRLEILAESLDDEWENEDGIPIKNRTIFYECNSCKGLFGRDRLYNTASRETAYLGGTCYPTGLTKEEIIDYVPKLKGLIDEREIIAKRK